LRASIPAPRVSKNQIVLAGLFLCKDGDERGSCANIHVEEFTALEKIYELPVDAFDPNTGLLREEKKPSVGKKADHLYFFRPLLITSDGALLSPTADTAEQFEDMLSDAKVQDKSGLPYVNSTLKSLGSYPLTFKENAIEIRIPHYNDKKCLLVH
jgi:hypothetical protein